MSKKVRENIKADVGRDCESDRTTVWPSNILSSPQPQHRISPSTSQRGNKHNLSLWKMSDITTVSHCSSLFLVVVICVVVIINYLLPISRFKTPPTHSHFQINIVSEKTFRSLTVTQYDFCSNVSPVWHVMVPTTWLYITFCGVLMARNGICW